MSRSRRRGTIVRSSGPRAEESDTRRAAIGPANAIASRLWRLFWLTVLVGHAMLALGWWWAQPGGFSARHPRFWSNRVAPAGVLVVSIATLIALRREKLEALRFLLPAVPAAWAGAGLACRIIFPITLEQVWLLPEAAAAVMGVAAIPVWRRPAGGSRAASLTAALGSALIGVALVFTQRVPVAATHPNNLALPELDPAAKISLGQLGAIRLGPTVLVQSYDGSITVQHTGLTITLEPLLTFLSRSPDGCPTVFVGRSESVGPGPQLLAATRKAEESCTLQYLLRGQGPAALDVSVDRGGERVAVEAMTRLDRPVYSHLNSFCDVEIRGHRRLWLAFSPCAEVPIEVRPSDYPVGRPARFAFLDRDGTFKVAEGSSGEKGPFAILASGRLASEQGLSITLYNEDEPMGRITFADWASQADSTLSPTAGWGVPVNAIEFSLSGDSPSSPASIFVTLAGTSVGRGWDCVGHVAGTYRNRITIEKIVRPEPSR